MINKNSSGETLSADYGTYVAQDSRNFIAKLFINGSELSCAIKNLTITKGSCGSTEGFTIGNVISSMLTGTLKEVNVELKGQTIEVRVGLFMDSDYEYITAGSFKVVEAKSTAYETTITAYGKTLTDLQGSLTVPSDLSIGNIIDAIEDLGNCNVTIDSGIDTSKVLTVFDAKSGYDALMILAEVIAGYAYDTYDGNIHIAQHKSVPTITVNTGRCVKLPEFEDVFTITGVQVNAIGQYEYVLTTDTAIDPDKTYYTRSGTAPNYTYTPVEEPVVADIGTYYEQIPLSFKYPTSGAEINLIVDCQYMNASLFDIFKSIVGYSYKPSSVELTLGDPRIEGCDVLSVIDINGTSNTVPCHSVVHSYSGGLSSTIESVKPTSEDMGVSSVQPISQRIDEISGSATAAKASAAIAEAAAKRAEEASGEAVEILDDMKEAAEEAGTTLTQIYQDAEDAKVSAMNANSSSNVALTQLGVVESIVGVLSLLSKNGEYAPTTDEEIQPNKWYFEKLADGSYKVENTPTSVYHLTSDTEIDPSKTYYTRIGSGTEEDPYVYTEVETPAQSELSTYYEKYYNLIGIDEAIENYVSSHLVLSSDGLWLQSDNTECKVQLSSEYGLILYGSDGTPLAEYGTAAIIGDKYGFHIEIGNSEIGFYQGQGSQNKVAYMNGAQLYVTNSLSFGHFIFIERENGHFTLKKID